MIRMLLLLIISLPVLGAQEVETPEGANAVLARVNGEAITLRQLEDELMRQEGAQTIEDLLRTQLSKTDWSSLKDEDIIVKVANIEVPRVLLINKLLEKYGADVREQMIDGMLVKQAIKAAGIELNAALKKEILERLKRKYYYDQEQKGDTVVPFDTMIQDKYGKSETEWMDDPAFLTLSGMTALLYQEAEISEDELRAYFVEHAYRYGEPEAYEISVLPFHFKTQDGKPLDRNGLELTRKNAQSTMDTIASKRRSFKWIVKMFDSEFQGNRGFVDRSGKSTVKGVERVPQEVMEKIFRHHYDAFPTVLGPIEAPGSLTIVEVRSYRKGSRPSLDQIRERVKRDLIDSDLNKWLPKFDRSLKDKGQIDYFGMLGPLQERREDLQAYLKKRQEAFERQLEQAQKDKSDKK